MAPTVKVLHLRVNAPNPGSWRALSQLVRLEDLQIIGPGGYDDWVHQSRSYSAWRLDDSFCSALQGLTSLRSLALDCAYEADFVRLAALTQLKHLSFNTWTNASSEGLVHLSSLTHLTSLEFWGWLTECKEDTPIMVQRRQAVQAQLGSALLSLQQLQQLELGHAPFGPVTDALAKLTALTQLALFSGGPDDDDGHHTWSLPSVQELYCNMTWQRLASLHAPQLRMLGGELLFSARLPFYLHRLIGEAQQQPKPGPEVRLAAARGPLRWCNDVELQWPSLSSEEVTEWLGSLGEAWKPDRSVLLSGSGLPEWKLELCGFTLPLVGSTLALLPSGLTHLRIR